MSAHKKAKPSSPRPESKRSKRGDGIIDPDHLYTLAALEEITGMGKRSIRMARRNGLKLIYLGNKVYCKGIDFIEFVSANGTDQHPCGR